MEGSEQSDEVTPLNVDAINDLLKDRSFGNEPSDTHSKGSTGRFGNLVKGAKGGGSTLGGFNKRAMKPTGSSMG